MTGSSLDQLNRQIFECRQQQQYEQALEFFRQKVHKVFDTQSILRHLFLTGNVMHCLRKKGKAKKALDFLFQYLQFDFSTPLPDALLAETGWAFYEWLKTITTQSCLQTAQPYFVWVVRVISEIRPANNYLLFSRLILELFRVAELGRPSITQSFLQYALKINPDCFSDELCLLPENNQKAVRPMVLASDRERFYMIFSKILYQAGRYQNCLEYCRRGLDDIKKFNGGNRIWLVRRLALCLRQLGQGEQAVQTMLEIARRKGDWFLWVELGELYQQVGQEEKALFAWGHGFKNQGNNPYKAGFYGRLAQWLFERNLIPEAAMHLQLAIAARKSQGWKIPAELQWLASQPAMVLSPPDTSDPYEQCACYWQNILTQQTEKPEASENLSWHHGTITAILNPGPNGDGFITTTDKQSIYFRTKKAKKEPDKVKTGDEVKVLAIRRHYKDRQVLNAVKIIFI